MENDEYILKHRDTDVLEFRFEIGSNYKTIEYINILDNDFCPFNSDAELQFQFVLFNSWLNSRYIPKSRDGITEFLQKFSINRMKQIMLDTYGLSLSDHYWIERKPFNNKWKDINLFENQYSKLFGNILINREFHTVDSLKDLDFRNPDVTTIGLLKKHWKYNQEEKISYLIKRGSSIYKQEPFNEYYASLLLDELGFEHTPYHLDVENDEYVSVCPCITDINTEMISARNLILKYTIRKNYQALKIFFKKQEDIVHSINKMIITDYLIDNTDRHWYNFGVLRNSITGSWIKLIPLFDNGYSLWNNDFVDNNEYSDSCSFASTNKDCMKFVNISDYVHNIPDMLDIFNIAFKLYEHRDRKRELKRAIKIKEEEVIKYFENNN